MNTQSNVDAEPGEVSRDEGPNPPRHLPGEAGIWVLLLGDMVVFAALCASYLSARGHHPSVFSRSQDELNRNLGAANTLILLTSSLLIVWATIAYRTERWRHLTWRFTVAGFVVGCCFVAVKTVEYHHMLSHGILPATNEFFTYYFVLTGLHLLHVVLGLGVLLLMTALARRPAPTRSRMNSFEGGACFWHMGDLLWLIIFPTIFLVR